jgi:hypothetical protein
MGTNQFKKYIVKSEDLSNPRGVRHWTKSGKEG